MRFFSSLRFFLAALTLFTLSGCNITTDPIRLTVGPGTVTSGSLTCAASTSLSSVISGQSFPVTIQVIGGVGPYSLSGVTGTFLTSFTVPQTLTVSGSNSQITTTNFTITDSSGGSTTCQLAVTVAPTTTTNPLSCSVAASTETPAIGASVTYTATATGGSSPYFFTGFVQGGNGVVTSSLNQTSTTQATASAKYPTSGLNTAVFYISDSSGNSATCAKTVSVQSGPSVALTASPSSTVPANSSILITATANNFTSTPSYVYTVSGAGLNLVSSGATATVTAIDSLVTRTGTVTVTASNGTQSATNSIPVTFTANPSTLNCSISYAASFAPYQVGDNVPFNITASTGEALVVTELNIQDGYLVGTLSQYPYISFYSSGTKTVTAKARSASTGVLCNAGAYLQTSITIASSSTQFSCTLSMTPNPTYTYTWILATVTPSGAQGAYWLESLTADYASAFVDDNSLSAYSTVNSTPINRWVYFTYRGNWRVTAQLRDSAGRTATCSTYEVIY